jgi:hypothetical protein
VSNSSSGGGNGTVVPMRYSQDQLIQAMGKYGDRWQIQQTEDRQGWVAVERLQPVTPPDPRVVTDKSLGGLVQKLRDRS